MYIRKSKVRLTDSVHAAGMTDYRVPQEVDGVREEFGERDEE